VVIVAYHTRHLQHPPALLFTADEECSMLALEIAGSSGHSSTADAGRNALDSMHLALNSLDKCRNNPAHRYCNTAFEAPVPTLNFGRIAGGDNANRVCGSCELHFDLYTLPAMQWDGLQQLGMDVVVCGPVNWPGPTSRTSISRWIICNVLLSCCISSSAGFCLALACLARRACERTP
jgi:hypothetical protein